jgi:hypothetical protein
MTTGADAEILTSNEPPSGADLAQEALDLYSTGDMNGAGRLLEKAYRAFVDAADHLGAVRVTTRLVPD